MSPDLSRALHDAVDTGPDDAPFDVSSLTGRIRRRRTVRAGVRSGVAVGAAGAVALGATWIGRPAPSVLPAARADAAPGTCGSDIEALAHVTDSPVGFADSTQIEDGVITPSSGGRLGTLLGRHFTLGAVTPATAEELELPGDGSFTQVQLSTLKTLLATAEQGGDGTPQSDPAEIDALREQMAALTAQIDADRASRADSPDALDLQVLVASGSTVVATSELEPDAEMSLLLGAATVRYLGLDLVTCAVPGTPGGVPLPTGVYSVYLTYRGTADQPATAVGPAMLSLDDPAPVAGLPGDFPIEAGLLGDRLVAAHHESSDRWVVEVVAGADDKVSTAAGMLGLDTTESHSLGVGAPPQQGPLSGTVDGWSVRIASATTADDEPSLVYDFQRD